jgi:hypothetical protein
VVEEIIDLARGWLLILATLAAGVPAAAGPDRAGAARVEARVGFHLERAEVLREALAAVAYGPCRRLASPAAWDAYLASLVDEGMTLVAHLDEATREAKRSGDAALRARVAATKRRFIPPDPAGVVARLARCARQNGAVLDTRAHWERVTAEIPGRRLAVAREARGVSLAVRTAAP